MTLVNSTAGLARSFIRIFELGTSQNL